MPFGTLNVLLRYITIANLAIESLKWESYKVLNPSFKIALLGTYSIKSAIAINSTQVNL